MRRSILIALLAMPSTLSACTTREPAKAEPADAVRPEPARAQRVQLELARVPDSLAQPVIAALGLDAIGLIAARHRIDPDWHIYWRNPGDAGLPTRLTSTPGEGSSVVLGPTILPAPKRFEASFGWADEAILFVPILAGEGSLTIRSTWVACQSEACVSGQNEATLASSAPVEPVEPVEDVVLEAMLDRIPRPLGDRLVAHAWTRTDERVTLELTLAADARAVELLPDASDPALFFADARFDPEQHTLSIDWRVGSPGHPLPASQGVLAWTDASTTRYFELSLPWPE